MMTDTNWAKLAVFLAEKIGVTPGLLSLGLGDWDPAHRIEQAMMVLDKLMAEMWEGRLEWRAEAPLLSSGVILARLPGKSLVGDSTISWPAVKCSLSDYTCSLEGEAEMEITNSFSEAAAQAICLATARALGWKEGNAG